MRLRRVGRVGGELKRRTFFSIAIVAAFFVSERVIADPLLEQIGLGPCGNPRTVLLGTIDRAGHRFGVYEHVWNWGTGQAGRQTRRLLVFRDGQFQGHYYSTGSRCEIARNQLICTGHSGDSTSVDFSAAGPENQPLVDGYLWQFDRELWSYNFCDAQ